MPPSRKSARHILPASGLECDIWSMDSARGECRGRLVEPRGDAGFGYDPAFLSDDLGITFGEASAEAKDRISHRARAIARLGESGLLGPAAGR